MDERILHREQVGAAVHGVAPRARERVVAVHQHVVDRTVVLEIVLHAAVAPVREVRAAHGPVGRVLLERHAVAVVVDPHVLDGDVGAAVHQDAVGRVHEAPRRRRFPRPEHLATVHAQV